MKLVFLRHGVAMDRNEWKDDDAKRPLTEEGKEKVERIAATLAKWDLELDLVITSPYVRARDTADIAARKLKLLDRLVQDERVASGFDAGKLAKVLADNPKAKSVMLVGHEPDFSEIIGHLIGGGRVVMKKGGVACVDLPDPKTLKGDLLWLVPPRMLT